GYKCCLRYRNRGTMCEDLICFSFLKCSLTGLWSKLQTCYKKERQGDTQEHPRTYYR
ncbi:unnamed protein product, partial [Sphagnum jensenii]